MDPSSGDESRVLLPTVVICVCIGITTVVVALRVYTRAFLIQQFGADDWALLVAYALSVTTAGIVLSNNANGQGRHMNTLSPETTMNYFRTFFVSIAVYNTALTAIRTAFLLQYSRVFTTARMKLVARLALALVSMWSASQLILSIFSCIPVNKFWDPTVPGSCIPHYPNWYINAGGNIMTDVLIIVIPLPVLAGLSLRPAQKIVLVGIFSLGFFTSTISIIRLKYIGLSADITYDNMTSSCWSCIEVLSGVTCASLPTLRPLAGRCFPGLRSITSRVGRLAGSKGSGLRNSRKKGGGSRTGTLNTLETNRSHVELLELRALEAERKRRHLVRTVDMAVESDGEGSDGILGLDDARRAEADSGREYRGPARHAPMSHRRGSSAPKPREMAPAPVHHVHAPTSRSETTLARPIEALLKADSSPTGVQTEIAGGRGRQQSEFRGTGIAVERKITVTRAKSVL